MNRIFKYPLTLKETQFVKMPTNSRILSFQVQHGILTIWAVVTPTATIVDREFRICGTGDDVPPGEFVGTVQDGACVWHLFDNGESPASDRVMAQEKIRPGNFDVSIGCRIWCCRCKEDGSQYFAYPMSIEQAVQLAAIRLNEAGWVRVGIGSYWCPECVKDANK